MSLVVANLVLKLGNFAVHCSQLLWRGCVDGVLPDDVDGLLSIELGGDQILLNKAVDNLLAIRLGDLVVQVGDDVS